jgi:DNA-binding response OmpR family regulator
VKVLVVEDTIELAALVQMALEQSGWEVDLAYDGAGALALARPTHHLLLVDLGLPDMTGGELVALLRRQAGLADIPAIWFTAQRDGAVPEGGVGMIQKPFDPLSLAHNISEILG